MNIELTLNEARVIGCMLEKETTTPDQYPLTLNALINACNQKSNREPVMNLDQATVQQILDDLSRKYLVHGKTAPGSRVEKYRHRFCNVGFGALEFSDQERGIICMLLLRGPQTPGELRSHCNRLCHFKDVSEVESALKQLMERKDGPFVTCLAREPGKRESRYAHCFSREVQGDEGAAASHASLECSLTNEERITRLEQQVDELSRELEQLKRNIL